MQFLIKVILSALIIALISEIAKRSTQFAAILAAMPLMSVLAMIWLYTDTHDNNKIIELSYSILMAVFPSLLFFLILPALLKYGIKFPLAMAISICSMVIIYAIYIFIMTKFGVKL